MKPRNVNKVAKPLPNRAALNRLDQSERTILDYSKQAPVEQEPLPAVLALVGKRRS